MDDTLYLAAIASGSNGNAYYIGNGSDALLVDAGVSAKQVYDRMCRLSLDIGKVRGIVVTHEHGDHIRGIPVLARKYALPVYITSRTCEVSSLDVHPDLIRSVEQNDTLKIGPFDLRTFSKLHDACEPLSVTVSLGEKSVSVLTDIGFPCAHVIKSVGESDAVFLETNYDEKLLQEGSYPVYIKNRISGNRGHLSNLDSARLVYKYASPRLKYLFLSHLSENNNTAVKASALMKQALAERPDLDTEMVVTDRYSESPLIKL